MRLYASLILDIHVAVNWQLPKQGICWPVSLDHIAGADLSLTFLPPISLHNRLLECPWCIENVIYAILEKIGTLIGYSLLKFNWKKYWNQTLKNYIFTIDHVLSFWSEKNKYSLFFMVMLQSGVLLSGLANSIDSVHLNRPFYSCLLSDLAFEWQGGWRWPCFDTDLTAFIG